MTPLIYASIVSDLRTMRLLVSHGADVNAHNDAGATALMWSVGDRAKLSFLLRHGADANAHSSSGDSALIAAGNLAEPEPAIHLLLANGADAKYANRGYGPLMAVAEQGNALAVKELLAHGADARVTNRAGYTALHAAAMSGNAEVVRLLLDAGADPNASESTHGMVPLHWAAASGDLATVRLLIARGARVQEKDSFNQAPALIWAIAGDRGTAGLIRFLISNGADPNSTDRNGDTALTWALRRGDPAVVALLRSADQTSAHSAVVRITGSQAAKSPLDAIQKSLPLLERSADAFLGHVNQGCVSCHHQAHPLQVFHTAQHTALTLNADWAKRQSDAVLSVLAGRRGRLLLGMGLPDRLDAAYDLYGLNAANMPANDVTDALVDYLTLKQASDGHWKPTLFRPPMNDSDFTITALAIKGLQLYAIPGRARELSTRVRKGRDWLAMGTPKTTEDRTFQILGLSWSGERQQTIEKFIQSLMQQQGQDGGWSQLPTKSSDAYATGEVLVTVLQSGLASRYQSNIRRGIDFLLSTQHDDGSWFVESRSMPVQSYFESDFPHRRSQFISCAATNWATLALLIFQQRQMSAR
jgi:ankyrin repeat protein